MSVVPGPMSFVQALFGASARLVEVPGAWLTSFIDNADEIWENDPLLSDDDDLPFV